MLCKHIFRNIQTKLNIFTTRRFWKRANSHNHTQLGDGYYSSAYLSRLKEGNLIQVGQQTYGSINAYSYGNPQERLQIGSFCSIAATTRFLLSGEHAHNTISTFPFQVHIMGASSEALCKGPIIIDDDVWLGDNALILSGVHIGQGAIVAAGSVVTRDIPPYAIAGGIPAKVIRYRFAPDMIEQLLKLDYSKLDIQTIREHAEDLYQPLDSAEQLSWFPRRDAGE